MRTLLPAIYLANRNQMIKEADLGGFLGRMAAGGVRGAMAMPGMARQGLGAVARGVEAVPGMARQGLRSTAQYVEQLPGRVGRGPLGTNWQSGVANFRSGVGLPLNQQQKGTLAGQFWDSGVQNAQRHTVDMNATPWLQRPVGFNSNGLAALAGTGAMAGGLNAYLNRQAGPDWGRQMSNMGMPSMPSMQMPVQFRTPFKTAKFVKRSDGMALIRRPIMALARSGGGAAGHAGASAAGGFAERALPVVRQGTQALEKTSPAIDVNEVLPWHRQMRDWLSATGPGQWAKKNPATAGALAGAGVMRGAEWGRNTVRENRLANMGPMDRLMLAGGLLFNPQDTASRLY